jgi:hypothetical protein
MTYLYKKIRISKDRVIDEHRYVMEKQIGRKLSRDELVHHKDENPRNNDIDNLEIKSPLIHAQLHLKGKSKGADMHGQSGYRFRKCRCEICVSAHAIANKQTRERKKMR